VKTDAIEPRIEKMEEVKKQQDDGREKKRPGYGMLSNLE
jgi:hypothetical protein